MSSGDKKMRTGKGKKNFSRDVTSQRAAWLQSKTAVDLGDDLDERLKEYEEYVSPRFNMLLVQTPRPWFFSSTPLMDGIRRTLKETAALVTPWLRFGIPPSSLENKCPYYRYDSSTLPSTPSLKLKHALHLMEKYPSSSSHAPHDPHHHATTTGFSHNQDRHHNLGTRHMQGSGFNLQAYGRPDPVKKSQEELSDALLFMPSHLTKTILSNAEERRHHPQDAEVGDGRRGGPFSWIKRVIFRQGQRSSKGALLTDLHSPFLPPTSSHSSSHHHHHHHHSPYTAHTELGDKSGWASKRDHHHVGGGGGGGQGHTHSSLQKRPYHIKPPGEGNRTLEG